DGEASIGLVDPQPPASAARTRPMATCRRMPWSLLPPISEVVDAVLASGRSQASSLVTAALLQTLVRHPPVGCPGVEHARQTDPPRRVCRCRRAAVGGGEEDRAGNAPPRGQSAVAGAACGCPVPR